MDRFEEMEGDLDDIDEDKERDKVMMLSSCSKLVVQSFFIQLGRIAQRMALDEDQANLKLFQDRSDII